MERTLISKSRISDSRTVCWLQNVRNKNYMVCMREELPTESASACYVWCGGGGTSEESTSTWWMWGFVWGGVIPREAASTWCVWGRDYLMRQPLHAVYWRGIPMEVASTCCALVGGLLRETPPQVILPPLHLFQRIPAHPWQWSPIFLQNTVFPIRWWL